MTRPSLSFVIPTRNQARFIRRCIDSCLAQGIEGAEIIVRDGASTDETREILASYGAAVRWVSQPDGGQSEAINLAVASASGDVVAWINSDDYYPDGGVLGRVVDRFAADAELDIVHGDGMLVDVNETPFRRYYSRDVDHGRALFAHPTTLVQPSVFFRRQLFLSAGGLRTDLHWAMDFDLWLRMFPAARHVQYVPEVLSCVRFHTDAKTHRGMLQQIREVGRLKRQHAAALRPDLRQRLGSVGADLMLYLYWAAVRLGLRRAA
ncbi:MAG: glycosyltransferase family 2 protein [Polyangia bacterium]